MKWNGKCKSRSQSQQKPVVLISYFVDLEHIWRATTAHNLDRGNHYKSKSKHRPQGWCPPKPQFVASFFSQNVVCWVSLQARYLLVADRRGSTALRGIETFSELAVRLRPDIRLVVSKWSCLNERLRARNESESELFRGAVYLPVDGDRKP